jgi:ABC-type nitrate/sulfonate/bicarbonate transport system permease component
MTSILRRVGQVAVFVWLPLLILLLIWFLSANSTSLYFPSASTVVGTMIDGLADGELLTALAFSLKNYAAGYALAAVLGIGLGLVLGDHRRIRETLSPALDFMRALPNVAFVPVFILALGIGSGPKIVLIAFGCVWPILLNTIDGVRSINPAVLETARSYGIPYRLRMFRVIFMGALPQIFAGLRIALAVGLILMIVSEMYGSASGIGYYILYSGQRFAVDETWAGTVLIGIVGYLITVVFLVVEHATLAWHFQRPRKEKRIRAV